MSTSVPRYKPKYGAKEICRLVDGERLSMEKGQKAQDPWLFVAASHALDFYESCEASNVMLDFTGVTQDDVPLALAVSQELLKAQGKSLRERREILAKRLAAYMLFQVYNDITVMGAKVDFACSQSSYALVAALTAGETLSFDFLEAATRCLKRFMIGGPFAGGTLQPFYRRLYEEFLRPLFKHLGVQS
ncbi:MAG: hypothetical protein IKG18_07315 [Atopobiaceae bacterium]|nr:hypothetical protein [Atopobiaceae bacterium]